MMKMVFVVFWADGAPGKDLVGIFTHAKDAYSCVLRNADYFVELWEVI